MSLNCLDGRENKKERGKDFVSCMHYPANPQGVLNQRFTPRFSPFFLSLKD